MDPDQFLFSVHQWRKLFRLILKFAFPPQNSLIYKTYFEMAINKTCHQSLSEKN